MSMTMTTNPAVEHLTDQLCTFRLGELYLGIDVLEVREVLHHAEVTEVPHADRAVEGLINLRGQIATAINLRRRLELGHETGDERQLHVVIVNRDEPVTLLVDAIGDVVDVERDAYEAPPPTLTGPARRFIQGAYKLEDELLLRLDLTMVIGLE
jgi:purine-binding chemotaxis protein CheW